MRISGTYALVALLAAGLAAPLSAQVQPPGREGSPLPTPGSGSNLPVPDAPATPGLPGDRSPSVRIPEKIDPPVRPGSEHMPGEGIPGEPAPGKSLPVPDRPSPVQR